MTKRITFALLILGGFAVWGCGSKATDEELTKMCRHFLEIEGKINLETLEERIATAEEEFKAKTELLKQQEERDLKGYYDARKVQMEVVDNTPTDTDSETDTMEDMTLAEKQAQREKVEKMTNSNLERIKKEYAREHEKLQPQKESAIRAAKVRSKEDAEKAEKQMNECLAEAKQQGLSTEVVQCRLQASTVYKYTNNCK